MVHLFPGRSAKIKHLVYITFVSIELILHRVVFLPFVFLFLFFHRVPLSLSCCAIRSHRCKRQFLEKSGGGEGGGSGTGTWPQIVTVLLGGPCQEWTTSHCAKT